MTILQQRVDISITFDIPSRIRTSQRCMPCRTIRGMKASRTPLNAPIPWLDRLRAKLSILRSNSPTLRFHTSQIMTQVFVALDPYMLTKLEDYCKPAAYAILILR